MKHPVVVKETPTIHAATSQQVLDALDQLLATGFYGYHRAHVAERLICEKLREIVAAGELKVPKAKRV